MDHIFVYAKPDKTWISELSAVRTDGQIGQTTKRHVIAAFTSPIDSNCNFKGAIGMLRNSLLNKQSDKYVVITYLSEVTRAILKSECEKIGEKEEIFAGRAWIDIAQLAWPLAANGMIKSRSIENLAKHFRVSFESKDDTADVCTAIVAIYGHMMRRYHTALAGEEIMRDVGGDTLENIRKMVGF